MIMEQYKVRVTINAFGEKLAKRFKVVFDGGCKCYARITPAVAFYYSVTALNPHFFRDGKELPVAYLHKVLSPVENLQREKHLKANRK